MVERWIRNRFVWAWACGGLCVAAYHSLAQDLNGQEEMIRRMQEDWIDASITVPIAIVLVVVALGGLFALGFKKPPDIEKRLKVIHKVDPQGHQHIVIRVEAKDDLKDHVQHRESWERVAGLKVKKKPKNVVPKADLYEDER